MNRKEYYSRKNVAKEYDSIRFRTSGGKYVDNQECSIINLFDLNNKEILDIPCGTGRLSWHILKKYPNAKITCADYSREMLKITKNKIDNRAVFKRIDLFKLATKKKFDFVLSLRFFFHYKELNLMFSQFNKLLKPRGILIFDTLNWSPHQLSKNFKSYVFSENDIVTNAKNNDFSLLSKSNMFILPSRVYTYLPKFFISLLIRLEHIWPDKLMTKSVWVFEKN